MKRQWGVWITWTTTTNPAGDFSRRSRTCASLLSCRAAPCRAAPRIAFLMLKAFLSSKDSRERFKRDSRSQVAKCDECTSCALPAVFIICTFSARAAPSSPFFLWSVCVCPARTTKYIRVPGPRPQLQMSRLVARDSLSPSLSLPTNKKIMLKISTSN